jgi:hypothetical protein
LRSESDSSNWPEKGVTRTEGWAAGFFDGTDIGSIQNSIATTA